MLGGLYLVWLAIKLLRVKEISLAGKLESKNSLLTAVKVNLLNPGPYIFRFTVGGSYIVRGTSRESTVFVVTSIGALIVSKIFVAVLAARFFSSLASRGYLLAMRLLAGALIWFGITSMMKAAQLGALSAEFVST